MLVNQDNSNLSWIVIQLYSLKLKCKDLWRYVYFVFRDNEFYCIDAIVNNYNVNMNDSYSMIQQARKQKTKYHHWQI